MKDYQHNKLPKNPKYLAVVRKTINNYRIKEDLSFDDIAELLGMTLSTLEQKLKPGADARFTVDEEHHIMELTNDYSILKFTANYFGYSLQKLNIDFTDKDDIQLSEQNNRTLVDGVDSFKATNQFINKKEKPNRLEADRRLNVLIEDAQQLLRDIRNINNEG